MTKKKLRSYLETSNIEGSIGTLFGRKWRSKEIVVCRYSCLRIQLHEDTVAYRPVTTGMLGLSLTIVDKFRGMDKFN